MDKDLIRTKLEALTRCISRIKEKTPDSYDELKNNYDAQDIISVNIERAVQNCVDIAGHMCCDYNETPSSMGECFVILANHDILSVELAEKLSKAVGFRNIAVHQYQTINWKVVYSICTAGIKDLIDFALTVEKMI
ncbi:MAG: DUF86 domain-containing protein [Treponema sp.]|nr:DUF86 domain-containing protein [Treponema sp.]